MNISIKTKMVSIIILACLGSLLGQDNDNKSSSSSDNQLGYETNVKNIFNPILTKDLLVKLGDKNFLQREKAQAKLEKLPHSAIKFMRKYANLKDPEISERLKKVIAEIKKRPIELPIQTLSWTTSEKKQYRKAFREWGKKNKPSTGIKKKKTIIQERSFAQSFKPNCKILDAISIGMVRIFANEGWMRLDVHNDDDGHPGTEILARCWVKILKKGPMPETTWLLFDLPNIAVKPKETYWFTFHQHSKNGGYLCAWSLSQENYQDGQLWRERDTQPMKQNDACFQLYSNATEFSILRSATEDELESLPEIQKRNKAWEKKNHK